MKKRTNRIGAAVLTLAMVVSMIPGKRIKSRQRRIFIF